MRALLVVVVLGAIGASFQDQHKKQVIKRAEEASRYARSLPPIYKRNATYKELKEAACNAELEICNGVSSFSY